VTDSTTRALALLVASGLACAGPTATDAGPPLCSPAPSSCPTSVPSYQGQVSTIIQATCLKCHGAGGPGTPSLVSYGAIHTNELEMLGQLVGCTMPPPDAGSLLDDADRASLLAWLVCGAPNN
jgi:hypothetical protein